MTTAKAPFSPPVRKISFTKIESQGHRLGLYGPGGAGKTTLAATAPGPVGFIDLDDSLPILLPSLGKLDVRRVGGITGCAPYPTWSLEGYANAYRLDLAHFDSAFYVFLSNCGYVGSDVGWADPATNGTAVSSSAVFHAMTNLKAGSWTGTIKALGPCTPAGKNVGDTITIDGTGWGDGVQTANDGPIMWVTGA